MNIKKKIPKYISLLLSFVMAFSNVIPAYAMETNNNDSETVIDGENIGAEESNFEDIKVTYKQSSSFFVTIPKTIALDGWKQAAYSVKVEGDIDAEQCVYVAPVDGISSTEDIDFYMEDQASKNKKANVVATVTQNKQHWNSAEVTDGYVQTDNLVNAPDLTAGTWKGIFQMEIRLETDSSHTHNFVDGVCTECGEADPDWHDPYETAPEGAASSWEYKLDEENGTIGLMGYNGTEKNVIVYNNYQINGKTYKTKLLGPDVYFNGEYSVAPSYYMFSQANNVETIIFGDNIDFSEMSCFYMFNGCGNLTSIDFGENFDTSNVTDMHNMFFGCQSLTSLDLSGFDTSNVTDMCQMFGYNYALTDLDLSSFDTSKAIDMDYMFYCSYQIKNIYVTEGKWSTSQAKMSQMFVGCGTDHVTYR